MLGYATVLYGPFNDVPALAVTAVLDLANRAGALYVMAGAALYISKLVCGLGCFWYWFRLRFGLSSLVRLQAVCSGMT